MELITLEEAVKPLKSDTKSKISQLTKGTLGGAVSGASIGLIYGWAKDKNMYATTVVGLMIGGVISCIMIGGFNFKKK